jgi:DNA-binding NarL/FixJ family response regulator
MQSRPLRLLIADQAPMRVGIRIALEEDAQVELCAEADDPEHAIRAAKREQPDLCLVGDTINGDAIAAIRGISRAAPQAAVVLLTDSHDADRLLDAVRAGAVGYVPGALDADRLRRIVRAVAADEAVVPRSMVLELLLELRGVGAGADALTLRESQVLGMLRRRHTTAEIAARLAIAPVTVRRHISQLVRKLGVEDRAALVAGARQRNRSGQAATDRVGGGLNPVGQPELGQDARDVVLNGPRADGEHVGDLGVL